MDYNLHEIERACESRNHRQVKQLIEALQTRSKNFYASLLHRKCSDCLELALSGELSAIDSKWLIHCCIENGDVSTRVAKKVFKRVSAHQLKVSEEEGEVPVIRAVRFDRLELLQMMLSVDPLLLNQRSSSGDKILDYAIRLKRSKISKFLLKKHAKDFRGVSNVNIRFLLTNDFDVIELAVNKMAKYQKFMNRFLVRAIEYDHLEAVKLAFSKNKLLINNPLNSDYSSALHVCALERNVRIMDYILTSFAEKLDLTKIDFNGYTAFERAVKHRIPIYLLKKFLQIDKNICTTINKNTGDSLLHIAVAGRNIEMIKYLLDEWRLDPLYANRNGKVPLFYLFEKIQYNDSDEKYREILALLNAVTFGEAPVERFGMATLIKAFGYSIKAGNMFLIHFCIDNFYGPAQNSKHELIGRLEQSFRMREAPERYVVCLQLHHQASFAVWRLMRNACELEQVLRQLHEEAFESLDRLATFYELLAEYWKHDETLYSMRICDFFVPPRDRQTPVVARRMFQALERVSPRHNVNMARNAESLLKLSSARAISEDERQEILGLVRTRVLAIVLAFSSSPLLLKAVQRPFEYYTPRAVGPEEFQAIKYFLPQSVFLRLDKGAEVLPLKHLCRLVIREALTGSSWQEFHTGLEAMGLPVTLNKYIRFIDGVI